MRGPRVISSPQLTPQCSALPKGLKMPPIVPSEALKQQQSRPGALGFVMRNARIVQILVQSLDVDEARTEFTECVNDWYYRCK